MFHTERKISAVKKKRKKLLEGTTARRGKAGRKEKNATGEKYEEEEITGRN